GYL
ncbi:preprotein translocase, SecA subunit, partial [Chlamydia psittaci 03DC29]